jgi:hypothetical protein
VGGWWWVQSHQNHTIWDINDTGMEWFHHIIKNFVDYFTTPPDVLLRACCIHLKEQFTLMSSGRRVESLQSDNYKYCKVWCSLSFSRFSTLQTDCWMCVYVCFFRVFLVNNTEEWFCRIIKNFVDHFTTTPPEVLLCTWFLYAFERAIHPKKLWVESLSEVTTTKFCKVLIFEQEFQGFSTMDFLNVFYFVPCSGLQSSATWPSRPPHQSSDQLHNQIDGNLNREREVRKYWNFIRDKKNICGKIAGPCKSVGYLTYP